MIAALTLNSIDATAVLVALIVATPPTLVALLAWSRSSKNAEAIHTVAISINGRMTQLLAATKGEAKAEGKEEGRAEAKE